MSAGGGVFSFFLSLSLSLFLSFVHATHSLFDQRHTAGQQSRRAAGPAMALQVRRTLDVGRRCVLVLMVPVPCLLGSAVAPLGPVSGRLPPACVDVHLFPHPQPLHLHLLPPLLLLIFVFASHLHRCSHPVRSASQCPTKRPASRSDHLSAFIPGPDPGSTRTRATPHSLLQHHLRLDPGRPAAYRTRRRLLCLHAPPLSRRKFDLALCTPSRNHACTIHLFFQNSYFQKSNHNGS
ncbi:uncharacterized protein IWZ02DRAFT_57342 [Phyllosticta citriasiana]|uniref:uncharacterized protein n=1 Tax=Phyllosticta citriasiana TaxID=595635 RepID=UPI0030FDF201